ncbi:hypothetical protein RIF23_11610 [Lipingzhangella sp. LS1_29]|uniref:Uncharacterized protein n=1 Tax=Lipingzhangella rawalii TaxID=2055835 RepID=A0ABU2H7W0_9ACTN|nr:hypothetical protein [Lipingzhangella rawalii]MDS1270945.1 hypothetical protein [Lipingzhangella rawalii]
MTRDPLDTHVEVDADGRTVSLWVDGYELRFTATPTEVPDHVDVLRRIMAAAERTIRLLREPEARTAASRPHTEITAPRPRDSH